MIVSLYYSPTGTGRRISERICGELGKSLNTHSKSIDFMTEHRVSFQPENTVCLAFPVYGGRIPIAFQDFELEGNGAKAIDALVEAYDLLTARGFCVIAAAAFIGEHSYTARVAHGRPDQKDFVKADEFASLVAQKLLHGQNMTVCKITGNRPYKPYSKFLLAKHQPPDIDDKVCVRCGKCVSACLTKAISIENFKTNADLCIACGACVKACVTGARRFSDPEIITTAAWLEETCCARKEPEWYL